MTERKTASDRSDKSDRIDVVGIILSKSAHYRSDQSDQTATSAHPGPIGPTDSEPGRTEKTIIKQSGPTGPTGPTDKPNTALDADGIARTDAAIDAVWDAARERAVRYRQENAPPTCASCGQADWTVSVTDPDGSPLHVECWKHRRAENELI